ncbi:MAG: protoglobin domain-containing protein [Deltaproteobacteria bacterium]
MSSIAEIKAHYNFTSGDADNLVKLRAVMQRRADEFVAEFYNHVKHFTDADKFLKDEATVKKHQDALKLWFAGLFSGDYGERYFAELEKVGMAHVKIDLPAHYVNASFHFVRQYAAGVIHKEVIASDERAYMERSLEKILDMNLDVFTSSYIAEEKKVFLSPKVESYLIHMANRFSHGLNIILVLGLILLGALVIVLIGYDFMHILDGDLEKGLLSTLGGLLMLWLVIELMDTEIKHLKGGKFAIKVFISVALVAFIRKILIMSLKSGETQAQLSLIAAIAVLGGVYWLVSKVKD